MAWIDDVVTRTTIRSVWGNDIRNHVVHTFATVAERDSHTAALPDGAICHVGTGDALYVKRAGAWYLLLPRVVSIGGSASGQVVQGVPYESARLTIPAGYGSVHAHYMSNVTAVTMAMSATANLQVASNAASVLMQAVSLYGAGVVGVLSLHGYFSVNRAGDQLAVTTTAGGGGAVALSADPRVHQLSALCLP